MDELKIDPEFFKLKEKLKVVEKKAPKLIYKKMDQLGRKIKKEAKNNTPIGKRNHNKRLSTGWYMEKTTKVGDTYITKVRNKRPHYHLVEKGHLLVKGKKNSRVVGKVKGKFFFQKTMDDLTPEIEKKQAKLVDDVFKKWEKMKV